MSTDPNQIRIGVFNCDCGINIAGVVDMNALDAFSLKLPNVCYAERYLSL